MKILTMAASVLLSLVLLGSESADAQHFSIESTGDEPVIHFTRLHHRVADVDEHQELSVFANGRVTVFTPVYMKNPGTFEYQLSSKAMQSLLTKLDANGLMSTDWDAVRSERDARAASRNVSNTERFHVSDLTATHITLNFAKLGKNGVKGEPLINKIVWNDIPVDAEIFSGLLSVQQLAAVEKILLQLTDHSRRNAVRIAGGR